jgi:hypothetical protein
LKTQVVTTRDNIFTMASQIAHICDNVT